MSKANHVQVLLEDLRKLAIEPKEPPETAAGTTISCKAATGVDSSPQDDQLLAACLEAINGTRPPTMNGPGTDFTPPSEEVFNNWFPGLKLSRTGTTNPSAGNAEDMYTNEGTGARRSPSPLLDWCRQHGAEVLAVQYPGRGRRLKEPHAATAQELAQLILEVVGSRLAEPVPYVVISHSMGCWIAYELLCAAREAGLPMPLHAFLSAMPSPDIPLEQRPWTRQRELMEEDFKEECRAWDINDIVFSDVMWGTYQPLLRGDFHIFDEYDFGAMSRTPLPVPLSCFWGSQDRRITEAMVQGWRRFTSSDFDCSRVDGNHLWPLNKEAKQAWLTAIVNKLGQLLPGSC